MSLYYISNLSFASGIFPEQIKESIVEPLHKKNSKLSPQDYWHISLVTTLKKILEKIMEYKLLSFLSKTNFISLKRFGFQSKINTAKALLDFVTKINDGWNQHMCTSGLFLHITKAFDTVNHLTLL